MMDPMSKLTLLGVAASAAVMAAGPDEKHAAPGEAQLLHVNMVQGHTAMSAKPATGEMLQFERMLRQKQQADEGRQIGNAFNATSWYVPPPPPPQVVLPPPPPTAPPLPFTYFGQYKDAATGAMVIFLSNADRVYTVSEGDVIDGTYSVGPITSGQLELTYMPLNIKQSLSTGGVS